MVPRETGVLRMTVTGGECTGRWRAERVVEPPLGIAESLAATAAESAQAWLSDERRAALRAFGERHYGAAVQSVPRLQILDAARDLGLLQHGGVVTETEHEGVVLFDHVLYGTPRSGLTSAQRYLGGLNPAVDPADADVRDGMLRVRYTVMVVKETEPGRGLRVDDLMYGQSLWLTDHALSQSVPAGAMLGGRILPYPDGVITTGALLPLALGDADNQGMLKMIEELTARYDLMAEDPHDRRYFAARTMRTLLDAGAANQMATE